jgi:hypothetical protein
MRRGQILHEKANSQECEIDFIGSYQLFQFVVWGHFGIVNTLDGQEHDMFDALRDGDIQSRPNISFHIRQMRRPHQKETLDTDKAPLKGGHVQKIKLSDFDIAAAALRVLLHQPLWISAADHAGDAFCLQCLDHFPSDISSGAGHKNRAAHLCGVLKGCAFVGTL